MTDEKRLRQAVFYLDESIYSRVLLDAMEAAGANVRRPGLEIAPGSPDEVWPEIVGQNNWISLMRDQRSRRRKLEMEPLKVHEVAAFAFTGGQETAQRTSQTICPLLSERECHQFRHGQFTRDVPSYRAVADFHRAGRRALTEARAF